MNELLNRSFKLWAYTVSHSFLILRSPQKFEDTDGFKELTCFNIDIEFYSVTYLDLPNTISEIYIKELKENIPEKFKEYLSQPGLHVFEILSCDRPYHVVASSYVIGRNNWVSDDRITNMNLQHD